MAGSPLQPLTENGARRKVGVRPQRAGGNGGAKVDFLSLEGWRTASLLESADGGLEIQAELLTEPDACRNCAAPQTSLKCNGTKPQSVRDVPHGGRPVLIRLHRRRFLCRACGKTTQQPLAGVDARRRLTRRLVELIEKESFDTRSSFVTAAARLGVSEKTVRNVFTERAIKLSQTSRVETPARLGIDGVYVGRKERCILTDLDSGRIIEILPSRDYVMVSKFLAILPDKGRVKVVAMDMCHGFALAAHKWLPQATVVIDIFHVQRLANQQLVAVFREHAQSSMARKLLRKKSPQAGRQKIRRTRFLLTKRRGRLSAEELEELRVWRQQFPLLNTAYKLKEGFLNIWQSETRGEAERRYDIWVRRMEKLMPWAFHRLRRTVRRWRELIFNYFDHPGVTNACTEGLNNTVKTLQRVGRGYGFHVLRAKLLYREVVTGRVHARRAKRPASRRARRAVNPMSNVERLKSAYEDRLNRILPPPAVTPTWLRRFGHLRERPVARAPEFFRPMRAKRPEGSEPHPLFSGLK
jgi:transposase